MNNFCPLINYSCKDNCVCYSTQERTIPNPNGVFSSKTTGEKYAYCSYFKVELKSNVETPATMTRSEKCKHIGINNTTNKCIVCGEIV